MARVKFRCGAPLAVNTDKRKTHENCRIAVAVEGSRCYHHKTSSQPVGATERSNNADH